ncbi:MAG: hypothetical protein PHS49_03395 [Candidatus Gracilibacteria bacterium]|nr:hypothetical protein [Candidatus Gracilibacteria bacterium]
MRNTFKILLFILISMITIDTNIIYAAENVAKEENNVILDAYSQRKTKILDLISGGKLETEIAELKTKLEEIKVGNSLNEGTKTKLIDDITKLESELISINNEIKLNVENSDDFDKLLEKYNAEIALKKDLVEQLNNTIKENEINTEKIDLLLNRYIAEKLQLEQTQNRENNIKLIVFIIFTLLSILVYVITRYLNKKSKLNSKIYIYTNFFLGFSYIIFLIWFFFYLYPQLSVFLIFISGYLLVINAHLIGSFIGSLIVLQRYKIGEIIKFEEHFGKIIRISPLYIVILPLTKEGIYVNKPVYIPHINILKQNVTIDLTADIFVHKFEITIRDDFGIDLVNFLNELEQNILTKFLHNKISSLSHANDYYRISFDRTNFGHIVVVFVWRGDDILNKKVERKIIGYLTYKMSEAKREKEKKEQDKEENKE